MVFKPIVPTWSPLEPELYLSNFTVVEGANDGSFGDVLLSVDFDVQDLMYSARANGPTAHKGQD
jgi:hypothetical protein